MTEEQKENAKNAEESAEKGAKEEAVQEEKEKPAEEPKEGTPEAEEKAEKPTKTEPASAEPAKEAAKEEKKPEPSGKFKELIKQIESLSALELAELVKELEERFGVSAAVPVAAVAGGAGPEGAPEAEEKANYTVVLQASGDKKIDVIKAVREINPDLGLKEAKDLVDNPPKEIKKDAPKEEAEETKKKLEAAGATVELK